MCGGGGGVPAHIKCYQGQEYTRARRRQHPTRAHNVTTKKIDTLNLNETDTKKGGESETCVLE